MPNWSRLVFGTLVLVLSLLWTAPEAAAYVLVSGIEYSNDTGVVGGFSATWRDPWDSDFEYCYAEAYDPWTDSTYCTEYHWFYFWVSVDAYVALPDNFVYVGSQTDPNISLVSWGGFSEDFGTWTEIGDHFYGRDAYYQNCYLIEYYFYCEPVTYWSVQSYSAYLGTTSAQVVVRPRILATGDTLWNFNFVTPDPPGYPTSIVLTSSGGPATSWTIIMGGNKIDLSAQAGTVTTVTPTFTASSGLGDIQVIATANGVGSLPFSITSRAPHRMVPMGTRKDCDPIYGYLMHVEYEVRDKS
jgi:hypothetical protein